MHSYLLAGSLGVALVLAGCNRAPGKQAVHNKPPSGQIVYASWYSVAANSLARRRAGLTELTAASDTLQRGTLVKVTRLTNGKSVIVRITDHGLHSRKSRLDLCKEAAEKLGMVRDGLAKVEVEVVPPSSTQLITLAPRK